jgi:hypothetical protein
MFTDTHGLQEWQHYQVLMYLIYVAHLVVPLLYRITSMYGMNSGICIAYVVHVAVASLLHHITRMYSTVNGSIVI